MAEEEKKRIMIIDSRVIAADFEIESIDNENLRAVVQGYSERQKKVLVQVTEIVFNIANQDALEVLQERLEKYPDRYAEEEIQESINLFSLKPETLERVYLAIKEVEEMEADN